MIQRGDCIEVMLGMDANSVDAIVTDPPYGLEFMGKDWDKLDGAKIKDKRLVNKPSEVMGFQDGSGGNPFSRSRHRFGQGEGIGKPMQEWHYAWAAAALRIAKPGAHLLAFGGTRTFHRLTCAIEDAGWEIRDCLGWIYGSGFPKSLDVSKAIDKSAGAEREVVSERKQRGRPKENARFEKNTSSHITELITAPATDAARQWQGWGTALKPAWEPIILARKPLDGTVAANVQKWGTGAINVDGCRVAVDDGDPLKTATYFGSNPGEAGKTMGGGWANQGENVPMWSGKGRWPANIIHDGSDEVLGLFPQSKSSGDPLRFQKTSGGSFSRSYGNQVAVAGDSGSAARFFYCAKASRKEREMGLEGMAAVVRPITQGHGRGPINTSKGGNGIRENRPTQNHHPTVKPVALMRYLCRLVTPPNGLVLDPFCGSGTTGIAAKADGFRFIGIDNNAEYAEIAEKRIASVAPMQMEAAA